jgi:hypothetical protein
MAVDSASPIDIGIDPLTIDFDTSVNINIDAGSTINVGIAMPTIIDTAPPEAKVDIARLTIIDTSSPTGAVSARTGGFDMAFGLFNFHVDKDGVAELISIRDSTLPAADTSTSLAIEDTPSTIEPPVPSEEEPRLETSTPSVGSNDFQDPPPSPTTAYCVDCDA